MDISLRALAAELLDQLEEGSFESLIEAVALYEKKRIETQRKAKPRQQRRGGPARRAAPRQKRQSGPAGPPAGPLI
jgi:hypothetical protein